MYARQSHSRIYTIVHARYGSTCVHVHVGSFCNPLVCVAVLLALRWVLDRLSPPWTSRAFRPIHPRPRRSRCEAGTPTSRCLLHPISPSAKPRLCQHGRFQQHTPASRNFFWSSVAGLIVDYMFTIDPAVLALGVHAEAVTPAALDAAFAYLTQNMTAAFSPPPRPVSYTHLTLPTILLV